MENEVKVIDITQQSIPLELSGDRYLLTEPTGKAMNVYYGARMEASTFDDEGKVVRSDAVKMLQTNITLLSQCLYKLDNGERQPVTEKFVEGLPTRAVDQLLEELKVFTGDREEDDYSEGASVPLE